MIIGISGKKQHGKDTVAKIIQYLVFDKRYPGHSHTIHTFLEEENEYREQSWRDLASGWRVKQFAGKLKQVVALLIGCSLKQLEDNKFKETPLGEEWRVWYKQCTRTDERIGDIYCTEQEVIDTGFIGERWATKAQNEILTPRRMLQIVGTECGRNLVHPNVWVNALMADYIRTGTSTLKDGQQIQSVYMGPKWDGNNEDYFNYPNWIVTDVRFPNEVKAIENHQGVVIRINRTNFKNPPLIDNHPSETSLDNWKFEYIINNNGTLEELIQSTQDLLKQLKIL